MQTLQRLLHKAAIAVTGPAEQGTDMISGMPAGPAVGSITAPPRRWSRLIKQEPGTGVGLGINEAMETMVNRLTQKWASDAFWRGFADVVKTADFDVVRKMKIRLERARPIITRNGQIRRLAIGA